MLGTESVSLIVTNRNYFTSHLIFVNPCPCQILSGMTQNCVPLNRPQNLGVPMDTALNVKAHIRKVCKVASYFIHRNGKIRKFLDKPTTERLIDRLIFIRQASNIQQYTIITDQN